MARTKKNRVDYGNKLIKTLSSSLSGHDIVLPKRVRRLVLDTLDMMTRPRNKMVPPLRLRRIIGVDADYVDSGFEWLDTLKDMGDLKPDDKVLDVGCGLGRIAIPLAEYLNRNGSYYGFDIVKELVDWCKQNISSIYPNFHFEHADIINYSYNMFGKYKASEYKFPYEDKSFNVVFLSSVFTHMLQEDMEHYFSEIARVLREGGKCLITFFLMNSQSLRSEFRRVSDVMATLDVKIPEIGIAYDEKYVRGLYASNNLHVKDIRYKYFCDKTNVCQDIVLALKNESIH